MIFRIIIFIFSICSFLACRSVQDEDGIHFIKGEKISFKVNDFASSNPGMGSLYASDSGEYLFLYNHVLKNLQISEFPSNRLKLNIPLEFGNEKRIKKFTGGTLLGKDSIFVTFYPPAFGMINLKGELVFEDKLSSGDFLVTHIGNGNKTPLFLSGSSLYGSQPYLMGHHKMNKEDVQKQSLVYSYDFGSKTSQWHNVTYAKDYWDGGKKLSYYSWAKREDLIYIAPYYDHEIQVFDTKTNSVSNRKRVASRHVQKFELVNKMPGSPEEAYINTLEHGQYEAFLYDQYRDVFYRVFFPPFEIEENYTQTQLNLMERSRPLVGVMVLDKDLNLIAEHVFDKFEVHPHFLLSEKGLYVSTNNMNRDDFSDDYASYQLMELGH